MSTPKTYTDPTALEAHIATCASEGISVKISENDSFVSVETTTRWGSRDLDIFRKTDGKKITSFADMKRFLHHLIQKG